MAKSLGEFFVKIGGDISELDKSLTTAEKKFQDSAQQMTKLGKSLTVAVTLPLLAAGAGFIKLADQELKAEAALANAIKATGKEATISVKSLQKYASELQNVTTYGDEAQVSALALVQQLANLDEKGLKQVLPRLLDFSTAMGVDLQTAASLVGKTLGSSTNALSRYGIEIDAAAEPTEKLAQLTAALEAKFGGAAEAAAKAGTGPLTQLKNAAGDLGEEFGKILIPELNKLVGSLREVVGWIASLTQEQKSLVIGLAGFAAAVGPVLLGVAKLVTIMPQLKAAMLFLNAHPAILAFTAIAAAVAVVAIGFKRAKDEANNLNAALSGNADLQDTKKALDLQIARVAYQRKLIAQADALGVQGRLAAASGRLALEAELATLKTINDNYNGKLRNLEAEKDRQAAAEKASAAERKAAEDAAKASAAALANIGKEVVAVEKKEIAYRDFGYQLDDELESYKDIEAAVARGRTTWEEADEARKEREIQWQDLLKTGVTSMLSGFGEIGAALVSGEDGWKSFGKAALGAVAAVLDALAGQLAAMAVIELVKLNFVGAAAAVAGSAAAYVAGGAVRQYATNLADGGIVMPKPGGTLANVAEAGVPEIVGPIDKVTNMLRASGAGVDSTPVHLVVNMDSRPFLDKVFDATRNRTVLISAGAVV